VSLLHGFAFAIFYTFVGIPVARFADTGSRRTIIAASALAWSFACAACGLARSFPQLFLGRIGVGVGEAGLSPAAYSMLADLFPPRRLGLAMSIFVSALYVGAGISLIIGGTVIAATSHLPPLVIPWIGLVRPWQLTFFVVGLPGVIIALGMLTVPEPARRGSASRHTPSRGQPAQREAFEFMARHARAYAGYIGGFTLISVIYNVAVAWGPTYLMRSMRVSAPDAGYVLGITILIAGAGGAVSGGILTDALRRRGRADAAVRVGLLSAIGTAPCGALAFLSHSRHGFEALFAAMLFAASMAFGAAAAGLQALTPNRMRAQASAAYLFALNLLAVGMGPTAAAMLTDYWFHDDLRVGEAVSVVICIAAPLAALALIMARKPFMICAALTAGPDAQHQEAAA
jgi:MFS family permease